MTVDAARRNARATVALRSLRKDRDTDCINGCDQPLGRGRRSGLFLWVVSSLWPTTKIGSEFLEASCRFPNESCGKLQVLTFSEPPPASRAQCIFRSEAVR